MTNVARQEVRGQLREALMSLSSLQREVVVLRLLEQQSLRSIAATLSITRAAVTTAYRAAIARMRAELPAEAFDSVRSWMSQR